jgi:ParB/RepB/Spo0J family partition protein
MPKTKTARAALQADAQPSLFETAPAPLPESVRLVSFRQLTLGDNPRKTYDEGALRELAESIRVKGILQSLLVRAGDDDTFSVIAGQRRWRAGGLLVESGVWFADEPRFPIKIQAGDDLDALLSAIVENNQREDVNPIEEGEAFLRAQQADKKTYSSDALGALIGRSGRYVQKRIALVNRLCPAARKALRAGEITRAQANALTMAPSKSEQDEVLRGIQNRWGEFETEADIRAHFLGDRPVLANAIFDPALYTGEVMVDEEDANNNRATDAVLFERLQREAVEAKRAAIEASGGKVTVLDGAKNQYFQSWEWSKDAKNGVTVIHLERDLSVTIHEDLKRKGTVTSSRSHEADGASGRGERKAKSEPWTKAHLALCHRVKSAALQRAVAADALTAMRLTIVTLLHQPQYGRYEAIAFGTKDRALDDHATAPELLDAGADILAKVGIKLSVKERNEDFAGTNGIADNPFGSSRKSEDLWPLVAKLSAKDVERLFAILIASRVGSFNGYAPVLCDGPFPLAVARSLDVDMAAQPNLITEAWLTSARKPQLVELIIDSGIAEDCRKLHKFINNTAGDIASIKTKSLIEVITTARAAGRLKGYVPRTLRFGTAADLAKAAAKPKAANPKKAKPAAKKKAKKKGGKR